MVRPCGKNDWWRYRPTNANTRTWKMEVGEHRKIGRLKLRWRDVIRKDMKEKGVHIEEAQERRTWILKTWRTDPKIRKMSEEDLNTDRNDPMMSLLGATSHLPHTVYDSLLPRECYHPTSSDPTTKYTLIRTDFTADHTCTEYTIIIRFVSVCLQTFYSQIFTNRKRIVNFIQF